jgi:hypothetical protein
MSYINHQTTSPLSETNKILDNVKFISFSIIRRLTQKSLIALESHFTFQLH